MVNILKIPIGPKKGDFTQFIPRNFYTLLSKSTLKFFLNIFSGFCRIVGYYEEVKVAIINFLKKSYWVRIGAFLHVHAQKLLCFFLGICSKDFSEICQGIVCRKFEPPLYNQLPHYIFSPFLNSPLSSINPLQPPLHELPPPP